MENFDIAKLVIFAASVVNRYASLHKQQSPSSAWTSNRYHKYYKLIVQDRF